MMTYYLLLVGVSVSYISITLGDPCKSLSWSPMGCNEEMELRDSSGVKIMIVNVGSLSLESFSYRPNIPFTIYLITSASSDPLEAVR